MSRHGRQSWWRRFLRRKPPIAYLRPLPEWGMANGYDMHIPEWPALKYIPLRNIIPRVAEPTEQEIRVYVADITDPDLKLPPLDAPLDETRFDLIRVHPYLPPGTVITDPGNPFRERGNDENRGQHGPDDQPASGGAAMDSGDEAMDTSRQAGYRPGGWPAHSGTRG